MTVPAFLNTGFYYESVPAGYADVQSLMDRLELILTTVLAPADRWSVITAASTTDGRWRTPSVGGRFSDFRLIRITATRLQVISYDQNGNVLMDRTMSPSASTHIEFYAGPLYCFVSGDNLEFAWINLHDLTGIPGAVSNYTVTNARRSSSNSIDGQGDIGYIGRWANGALQHAERVISPIYAGSTDDAFDQYQSMAGSYHFGPIRCAINEAGNERQGGPLYQCVWVDGTTFGPGDDIVTPIDDGVTATFRVVPVLNTGDTQLRIAYRKA